MTKNDKLFDAQRDLMVTATSNDYRNEFGQVVPAQAVISVLDVASPEIVSPIGNVPNTSLTLNWGAVSPEVSGEIVRYEVDVRTLAGTSVFSQTGIEATALDVSADITESNRYEFRVRAVNEAGTGYSNWSAYTAFNNVIPATQPALEGQAHAVNNEIPQTSDVSPILMWPKTGDAAIHSIYIENLDATENYAPGENSQWIYLDASTPGFNPENPSYESRNVEFGRYRAWVKSRDILEQPRRWSPWSFPHIFDVVATVPKPVKPVITSPDAVITDTTPRIRWDVANLSGVDHFQVWLATQANPSSAVHRAVDVRETNYNIPIDLPEGDYVVYVKSVTTERTIANPTNPTGIHTWSAGHQFELVTGIPRPSAPVIIAPTTFVLPDNQLNLSWLASTHAVGYYVWINNLTTGEAKYYRQAGIRELSHTPTRAFTPGTYVAWVQAYNSSLQKSPWSASNFFVVPEVAYVLPTDQPSESQSSPTTEELPNATQFVSLDRVVPGQMDGTRQIDAPASTLTVEPVAPDSADRLMASWADLDWWMVDSDRDLFEDDEPLIAVLDDVEAGKVAVDSRAQAAGLALAVPVFGGRLAKVVGRFRRKFSRRKSERSS